MRLEFIHAERANFPLEMLCRILEVSRSGYYRWLNARPSGRSKHDDRLRIEIVSKQRCLGSEALTAVGHFPAWRAHGADGIFGIAGAGRGWPWRSIDQRLGVRQQIGPYTSLAQDVRSPRMTHHPREISPETRDAQHRAHTSELKEIIGFTKTDRDDAVSRARQMLDNNQRLWQQAHEASQLANHVLRETVEYERQQADQARHQNSGRIKLQAHAVSEMERSRRFGDAMNLLRYGWDSAMANVVPVAARLLETLGGDRVPRDFPQFRWAQQAMAYLVMDLTPTQLDMMFEKDRKAAGAFLGRLDQAASMKNEREALEHAAPLVRFLRMERFRDVTHAEQQLAARFIINRLAMYRMADYGEDDEAAAGATNAG